MEFKYKYIIVNTVCSNKDRYTLQKNDAVYAVCNKTKDLYANYVIFILTTLLC